MMLTVRKTVGGEGRWPETPMGRAKERPLRVEGGLAGKVRVFVLCYR